MRVLYVSTDPGIHLGTPGGGAVHIREFVKALAELGHTVTVVATSAGAPVEGAETVPAPVAAWNRRIGSAIRRTNVLLGRAGREHPDLVRFLHNGTFRRVLNACVESLEPEVIFERYSLWGGAGASLAARRGIPFVLEVNAPLAFEQERYRGLTFPALARLAERHTWRSATLVAAVSQGLRPHLEAAGVRPDRIVVVPNGVDPSVFHPRVDGSAIRKRLGLEGKFVIGATGTFKPWHGTELLLDSFREVRSDCPAARLLLVGDGPLRQRVEEAARKSLPEGSVTFTGSIPHDQTPSYVAAMDVAAAVYPALQEQYFSPLKLFEYMAMGSAIVASRSGQAAEILSHGASALLFEPGDCAGLAECIRRLYEDVGLRERLRKSAAEASREFTWRNNAMRILRRLDQLAGRPSRATGMREEQSVA